MWYMLVLYELTKILFKYFEAGHPFIDANNQFLVTSIIFDVGSECVPVDEQLEINATTEAGARLIKVTVDVLANMTGNVPTLCQCKVHVIILQDTSKWQQTHLPM